MIIVLSTVSSYGPYAGDWSRHISRRFNDRKILSRDVRSAGSFGMGVPIMWGAFTAERDVRLRRRRRRHAVRVRPRGRSRRCWYVPLLLYLALASGTAQAVINTYGTGLDTSSIIPKLNRVQATLRRLRRRDRARVRGLLLSGIIDAVSTALSILACFSVSWIVAMIIGFVHRKGFYLTDDLQVFNRGQRGGRYWFTDGLNWRATGPWLLGAAVGMLFTNTTWFLGRGPTSSASADIGFLVSAVITGVLYPVFLQAVPGAAQRLRGRGC